jgi:hypothetical protein
MLPQNGKAASNHGRSRMYAMTQSCNAKLAGASVTDAAIAVLPLDRAELDMPYAPPGAREGAWSLASSIRFTANGIWAANTNGLANLQFV